MLFNSFAFCIFLPTVFLLYWFVFNKSNKYQNVLILLASYFFYGWFDWRFVFLLILSTIIDYSFGFLVEGGTPKKKKLFLWLSIANNLLILGFFKYYNFFTLEIAHSLDALGVHIHPYLISIALPLGISFYTFHGMSYVIDIYRGNFKPIKSFIDYAVFVCFFPLLVAGPIERASHLLPQITSKRKFVYSQAVQGLRLMIWGFVKKVVFADSLAPIVDDIFKNYHSYSGSTLVLGAVYFSFQIYGDFSGYSDIAIGTAKLFGFELLTNFRFPFASKSTSEFWRRWHISLSTWFNDYIFNPTVIALRAWDKLAVITGIMLTFFLSGFWHGAGWKFIVFGIVYGISISYEFYTKKLRKKIFKLLPLWLNNGISLVLTFLYVSLAFIIFRSPTLADAFGYIGSMTHHLFQMPQLRQPLAIYILPFIAIDWYLRKDERDLKVPRNKVLRYMVYCFMFLAIVYYSSDNASFIYFQF